MRTQQRPVRPAVVEMLLPALDRDYHVWIALAAQLAQFAVQVCHAARTGTFVQVVDILRHNIHIVKALQLGYGVVRRIGLYVVEFAAAHVVELDHEGAVARQSLGCTYILYAIVRPQSVGIAEGGQAAVGTHPRTRKYHDLLHIRKCFYTIYKNTQNVRR